MSLTKWLRKRRSAAVTATENRRLAEMGLSRSLGERQYPAEPGTLEGLDPDHVFRYEWARPFCEGRSVLDYGCGVGYGSYILSRGAARAVGFDISRDALDWARHYAARRDNLSYVNSLPDEVFDCITCFECIEHVPDPGGVLEWLAAHTTETLFISTPEAKESGPWSPFHTVEFSRQEFLNMLSPRFDVVHEQTQLTNGCSVVLARCRRLGR